MTDAGAPFGRFLNGTARPFPGTWKMSARRGGGVCLIKHMSDGHIYNAISRMDSLMESASYYSKYTECLADLKSERDQRQQAGTWDPTTNRGDPSEWLEPPEPVRVPVPRSRRGYQEGLGRSPGPPAPPIALEGGPLGYRHRLSVPTPDPTSSPVPKAVSYKRKVSLDDL